MVLHADYTQGSSYTRDFTVVSNTLKSNYITVRDENGNLIRQKKDAPIFDSDKKRAKEVAYYQEQANVAGEKKAEWGIMVKKFWTQLNNLDKNDELYSVVKKEYWEARFAQTAAGNREHSALTNAFIAAT